MARHPCRGAPRLLPTGAVCQIPPPVALGKMRRVAEEGGDEEMHLFPFGSKTRLVPESTSLHAIRDTGPLKLQKKAPLGSHPDSVTGFRR